MNLWIKYAPLIYINSTRLNGPIQMENRGVKNFSYKEKLSNILGYTRKLIMSGFFVLLYLALVGYLDISNSIFYFGLYIYLYITFLIFYEIGYIYNDVFSVRKEKKPTNYICDNLNINFRKINIIYRIVLGLSLLLPIYFLNKNLFFGFIIILFIMCTSYVIHNIIRNYNVNIFTRTILRTCKIMIFIILILNIKLIDNFIFQKISEAYLIFNSFDFFISFILVYNKRLGGVNTEDTYRYSYINMLFINILFGIILKNPYFLIVSIRIYPGVIKCLITLFKKYGLKSNR